jgi:hypothetical protein
VGQPLNLIKWLLSIIFPKPKRQRIGLMLVPYKAADALIEAGWSIAPEEDNNHRLGIVYLEKLE